MCEIDLMAQLKNNNFNAILALLRELKTATVGELAEKSKISFPTVKKALDYGVECNMVIISEIAPSTGGRKACVYSLNDACCFHCFCALINASIILRIYNFGEDLVFEKSVKIKLNEFLISLNQHLTDAFIKYPTIKSVNIVMPAVVNNGIIVKWYSNSAFENVNLIRELNAFGVKINVENDMKTTVYANIDKVAECNNFSTIQFGCNGIGVASMVDGVVLKGANGFAGEVGYMHDINRNYISTRYCGKIINSLLVYTNPSKIIFYSSDFQNNIAEIMQKGCKFLPNELIPQVITSDNFVDDVFLGMRYCTKADRLIKIAK